MPYEDTPPMSLLCSTQMSRRQMHNLRRQQDSSHRLEAQKGEGKQRHQAHLRERRETQINYQIPAKTQKLC